MRSRFGTFVEACDETRSVRAVKDLLSQTITGLGFNSFALMTHAPRRDLRSLGVLIDNWSDEAIEHMFGEGLAGPENPLFAALEDFRTPLRWQSEAWRATLTPTQMSWMDRLGELTGSEGVSAAMRCTLISASCSLTSTKRLDSDWVQLALRIANHAYHHTQYLQRPDLREAERLTLREHLCLYRAAVYGERPSGVARKLGVKVSTIRTLRQKAHARLDAESVEQAVWRMIETGQLFRNGRRGKPRSW